MRRLLLAAALLFTARIDGLALLSLEDAFYAREAVEMERAGRIFTVTWAGEVTHQHPPLQLWLVSRAYALLGERDLAARLPTVLMALGTLAATYRVGTLTVGREAAVTGVALLLATPIFVQHARRLMMEVPLTLWVTLTVLVYLQGLERPRRHVLLGLPLGAALLTKSVLGLMPLLAIVGAAFHPALRPSLRRPWLWLGVGLGLALGAAWPAHQALTQGLEAARIHYLGHVVRRSTGRLDMVRALIGYPWILLKFYQPLVLPAGFGLWWLRRRPEARRPAWVVLATWILLPIVLYSASSFRTPRFIFPMVPALALVAGAGLAGAAPRLATLLTRWIVPAGAVVVAAVLWVSPGLLDPDPNAAFKRRAGWLQATIPAGETVPYLGDHYWLVANPLLYYGERRLDRSSASAEEAIQATRAREARLLLCSRRRCPEVLTRAPELETVAEGPEWALLRVPGG